MLGVDIGCGAIKLALMDRRGGNWCLRAYAVQCLPKCSSDSALLDSAAARDGLAAALKQLPGKVHKAAVALNCNEAITRTTRLDAGLQDQDIENELAVDADEHLPFPLSDASMDFCRLGERVDAQGLGQEVFWVACRHERLAQRVRLLTGLGLHPAVVDLDALALSRIAGEQSTNTPHVVLDLGASGFRLHAFAGGRLLYSRCHQLTEPMSGDVLSGSVPQPQPDKSRATKLAQEIRRAVQLFLISTACQELFSISMVGGLASLPGLAAAISESCGRPVKLLSPPSIIRPHPRMELAQWRALAPQLLLACALAMREN